MYTIENLENYCEQAIEQETRSIRVLFFGYEGHFPTKNFVNEVSDHLLDRVYGYINIKEGVETKEQAISACKNALTDCIHDAYMITGGEWWIYNKEWKDIFTQYQDDIDQIIDSHGGLSLQEITTDSNTILDMEMKLIEYALLAILQNFECLCEDNDIWDEIVK